MADRLGAEVVNVAEISYDNQGIFLNAMQEIAHQRFDLVLLQMTELTRMVISPNMHGHKLMSTPHNICPNFVSDRDYENFVRVFTVMNTGFEHWRRLTKIIDTVQYLCKQGENIRFLNGLLSWQDDFFTQDSSDFMSLILDEDNLPDSDIAQGRATVNQQKQTIELDLWLNPFESIKRMGVDKSMDNSHPGPKTQEIVADYLYKKLGN